jgi:hypothetical protein
MNDLFSSDIFMIVGGKNKIFFSTYLPIGQIDESEKGNKAYFYLGPNSFAKPLSFHVWSIVTVFVITINSVFLTCVRDSVSVTIPV